MTQHVLLVGTRKGAFFLRSADRQTWKMEGPHSLGCIVNHIVQDPRDPALLLMGVQTGHLGPTILRSNDQGKSWTEATTPPKFEEGDLDHKGKPLSVKHTFWLTPGHANESGVWYCGSAPAGLFRSEDGGDTWQGVAGWNNWSRMGEIRAFSGLPELEQPLHSILVDPRNANHLYISVSAGGTFESTDHGATWSALNAGVAADFLPEENPEIGHDPHCVVLHPLNPDRLYQQNHCGIYRMDRADGRWVRIGDNMPKDVGDSGFVMTPHPRKVDTIWVFPMDSASVWPRTCPEGKAAVYRSDDAGQSWRRQDKGLPQEHAWLTVKRQSMCSDQEDSLGLYFGTTSGELWASTNEGAEWTNIARHLPLVTSVRYAKF